MERNNQNCFLMYRSPLTKIAAEKSRDILAAGLYDKMFGQIIKIINKHLSPSSINYSIGILDIAGFGELTIFFYSTYIPKNLKLILK